MDAEKIRQQSKAAYAQWHVQWAEHAKIHSKFKMKNLQDLENSGIGRAVLCVANGYTFEENLETIKKYQHNVDILCCDKTLAHLIENGITPTYCLVCDANVDFDKYCARVKDKLKDTILFMSACANPRWSQEAEWKDIYFFVNKDIINSEREFSALSGCKNFIPAGTNVSNAMVVFLTQSDNEGKKNFFGYDKILLIGFDYSWRYGKKYYAFDGDGGGKDKYMRHIYLVTHSGEAAYSSGNLIFSAQWLETYIRAFGLPIIQCSKASALGSVKVSDLETQMQYKYKPEDSKRVRSIIHSIRELVKQRRDLENQLNVIGKDHTLAQMAAF